MFHIVPGLGFRVLVYAYGTDSLPVTVTDFSFEAPTLQEFGLRTVRVLLRLRAQGLGLWGVES